jgi:hypothetical protein
VLSELIDFTFFLLCNMFIKLTDKWGAMNYRGGLFSEYFARQKSRVAVSGTSLFPACLVRHSQGRHIRHDVIAS